MFEWRGVEEQEVLTRRLLTSSVRASILAVSLSTTTSKGEGGVVGSIITNHWLLFCKRTLQDKNKP